MPLFPSDNRVLQGAGVVGATTGFAVLKGLADGAIALGMQHHAVMHHSDHALQYDPYRSLTAGLAGGAAGGVILGGLFCKYAKEKDMVRCALMAAAASVFFAPLGNAFFRWDGKSHLATAAMFEVSTLAALAAFAAVAYMTFTIKLAKGEDADAAAKVAFAKNPA